MSKTPVKIASVIFFLIGLVHLARLVFQFEVLVAGWAVPLWINAVAAGVALLLSFWLFKTRQK